MSSPTMSPPPSKRQKKHNELKLVFEEAIRVFEGDMLKISESEKQFGRASFGEFAHILRSYFPTGEAVMDPTDGILLSKSALDRLRNDKMVRLPEMFSSSGKPRSAKTVSEIKRQDSPKMEIQRILDACRDLAKIAETEDRHIREVEKMVRYVRSAEEVFDFDPTVNQYPVTVVFSSDLDLNEKFKIAVAASVREFHFREQDLQELVAQRNVKNYPVVSEDYSKSIEKAKRKLRAIISQNGSAPLMLKLAWHSAGNYMLGIEEKASFAEALKLLKPVKEQFPCLSHGDIHQLAGVVAIEVTGGPDIEFHPGRQDTNELPPPSRLPRDDHSASQSRAVFRAMGFSDRDIVALCGAHTLGSCHKEISGIDGSWTKNPFEFDNSYYKELLDVKSDECISLPSERALVADATFRPLFERYSVDEDKFFTDYARAHQKMSEYRFGED